VQRERKRGDSTKTASRKDPDEKTQPKEPKDPTKRGKAQPKVLQKILEEFWKNSESTPG
jgi:fructose-1,6-bisphosphatase